MEKYTLRNGIIVLVDDRKDCLSTSVVFQFLTGTANEKGIEGVAHFVEHILFSGTTSKSKEQIKSTFQNLGCYYNASTSLIKTKFYIKTINEYFIPAFKLLADIISNPLFDRNMIDIERKVIKDEILKNQENLVNNAVEKFRKTIFQDSVYARLVLGTLESVDKISEADLIEYYQENFTSSNLVVSFSGDITLENAIRLVEEFVRLPMGKKRDMKELMEVKKGQMQLVPNSSNQVSICMFIQGFGSKQKEYEAYQLLIAILGGNTNSRLFRVLRDNLGLVYHVQTFTENYIQFGLWGISFSCSISNVHTVLKAIKKMVVDILAEQCITLQELENAKKDYKVSLITGLETSSARANYMATKYWNGYPLQSIFEGVDRVAHIRLEDIQTMANTILGHFEPNVLVVGGDFKKEDFAYLIK